MSFLINFFRSIFHTSGEESHIFDEDWHKLPCHGHEFPQARLLDLEYYYSSQSFHYLYMGTCHLKTFIATKAHLYRENINTPHAYLCVEGRYQFADVDKSIYACFERSSGLRRPEDGFRPWYLPQRSTNRVSGFISETYQPRRNRTCTLCSTLSFDPPISFFSVTLIAQIVQTRMILDGESTYMFAGKTFEFLRSVFPAETINATGAGGSWYFKHIYNDDNIKREQAIACYNACWAAIIDEIEVHEEENNHAMATEAAQTELVRRNRAYDERLKQYALWIGPPV
ncbi:hypothetical protein BDN70DRAFT_893091 [Pholiota conissans]|uniref:Uncharacterized protein n=1 Tax=Pholiota conissans TaxID=109636 RepID=A0A9P6D353_9AGAR|nr:hypothetical protein BDN70DRAFT_893091 [Pholiota conissans]